MAAWRYGPGDDAPHMAVPEMVCYVIGALPRARFPVPSWPSSLSLVLSLSLSLLLLLLKLYGCCIAVADVAVVTAAAAVVAVVAVVVGCGDCGICDGLGGV
eukprot:7884623-Alexandrium_andersonii.AAC.1